MSKINPGSAVDPEAFASKLATRREQSNSDSLATEHVTGVTATETQKLKAENAGQQFEAMFLRQMLEEFMPKDSQTAFGSGTAGTIWRSMFADSIATTMSKGGSFGLARLIAGHDLKANPSE